MTFIFCIMADDNDIRDIVLGSKFIGLRGKTLISLLFKSFSSFVAIIFDLILFVVSLSILYIVGSYVMDYFGIYELISTFEVINSFGYFIISVFVGIVASIYAITIILGFMKVYIKEKKKLENKVKNHSR